MTEGVTPKLLVRRDSGSLNSLNPVSELYSFDHPCLLFEPARSASLVLAEGTCFNTITWTAWASSSPSGLLLPRTRDTPQSAHRRRGSGTHRPPRPAILCRGKGTAVGCTPIIASSSSRKRRPCCARSRGAPDAPRRMSGAARPSPATARRRRRRSSPRSAPPPTATVGRPPLGRRLGVSPGSGRYRTDAAPRHWDVARAPRGAGRRRSPQESRVVPTNRFHQETKRHPPKRIAVAAGCAVRTGENDDLGPATRFL